MLCSNPSCLLLVALEVVYFLSVLLRIKCSKSFLLLEFKHKSVNFKQVVSKSWFSDKAFVNKFLSGSTEYSVMDVGFPEVKDFGYNIVFEK